MFCVARTGDTGIISEIRIRARVAKEASENRTEVPSDGYWDRLVLALQVLARRRGGITVPKNELADLLTAQLGRKVGQPRITEWLGVQKAGVWTTEPKPSRDIDVVWAFARICGVPPAWLAFGEGEDDVLPLLMAPREMIKTAQDLADVGRRRRRSS